MKKNVIVFSVALAFSIAIYSLNTMLRWNYYKDYPHAESYTIEIATNIDKVGDYKVERSYFEEIKVTEYWRAGDFPMIVYTKTEENLGVFSREKR